MTKLLLIFLLIITFSCRQELSSKHYKSQDEITGGFNDFYLDLESNGTLRLLMNSSELVSQDSSGVIWEKITKLVSGKWYLDNGAIKYSFNESKATIDSFFVHTDWYSTFHDKPILSFSKMLDTAFVFSLPCILTECETVILNTTNQDIDTLKVRFLKRVVFDTTAVLVHGKVIDRDSKISIENASITLEYGDTQYFTNTDKNGEFEFFKNIPHGAWSIKIAHPNYTCLNVDDVVQFGGQWLSFYIRQKR